ncbi:DUF1415 domain-containing protein [Thalassotalea sp. LPB0316]|uniref:DUF1415 domain-containing protein n=1 Tax=Thalassotalea sp. LPB0316 TaxID=2769490 RepID=UPI001866B2E6|nr:DUF1415 domain-containing protein [Thalassotalea sp. LPB0316]QOL25056.1 DUF1415 domain-containing protein [Thalassotalea sp. LPB0316]
MSKNTCQTRDDVLNATKNWLLDIVIGLNFCPFAKKEWLNNTIAYCLDDATKITPAIDHLLTQCDKMVLTPEIETSLMIYPQGFTDFEDYLDLVDLAQQYLAEAGFEGQFQLASFHPDYCFDGLSENDVENYTNRSPYPMLHIIREDSMAKVLSVYKNPEQIPEDNMQLARAKGVKFFEQYLVVGKGVTEKDS